MKQELPEIDINNSGTLSYRLQSAGDIGEQLRRKIIALRRQKKLTQKELAERTGINLVTYRYFEQKGKISLARFLRICEALNRLDDFYGILNTRETPPIDFVPPPLKLREEAYASSSPLTLKDWLAKLPAKPPMKGAS
jgi:transcriptional regulator with XRE-family HTH domain